MMGKRICALIALALLSGFAFGQHRPLPNSFVDYRVRSVGELVDQVKTDQAVRDRFQRHFAMSEEDLISFLSSLHETKLSQTQVFTVYSVPPSGYVKAHLQKIKAGTPIFSDRNDKPVLLVECGNPLSQGPSNPTVLSATRVHGALGDTHDESIAEPTAAPPVAAVYTPSVPEVEAPAPAAPVASAPVAGHVAASGGGAPWLLLGAVPFVFLHGSHGSNHGHQPVPEPASFVALGLGAVYLVRRKVAKKKL